MLPLADAQTRLLALTPLMPAEDIATHAATGRVLARDLAARRTQPPADVSAMDGYAVAGRGPWTLAGESRAGFPFAKALKTSHCVRISTGAVMPEGADAVLLQENALVAGARVRAGDGEPEARYIRRQGFDFEAGDTLLAKGARMNAARIALALAGGHAQLAVAQRPCVAILDSGDELVRDPNDADEARIPATNGAMVAAMLHGLAQVEERRDPVVDDRAALAEALRATREADILITTGGASVGDHDLVQAALIESGADLAFWRVAIKPGKPLMVATRPKEGPSRSRRPQVVLGLPGNPVSAFVTAFLFALPLVRSALGDTQPLPTAIRMVSGGPMPATGPRRQLLRGVVRDGVVQLARSQDSSALAALAAADCLVDRAPNAPAVSTGDVVSAYWLRNG